MTTKRTIAVAITTGITVAAVALTGIASTVVAKDAGKIKSDRMIGVPATMTGTAGNVRGVNGGGLPWSIGEAEISVKASGKVDLELDDLVFAAGPNVGRNTISSMAVVVSCLDASNQPVNVVSASFPVTVATASDPGGDAHVRTSVELPQQCFAPIALVTNATGAAWFAVDGL